MEVFDPLADARWTDLVDRLPDALIFHHPAWIRLVCGVYRYPVEGWGLATESGELAAALPVALLRSPLTGSRLIALPFSETCSPLIDPASGAEPADFAQHLDAERRRRGLPLEVRGEIPAGHGAFVSKSFIRHRLALEAGVAAVEARFAKRQVKRGIAKAVREGVTIERCADEAGLRRFYRLHVMTRRRQGLPTPSKRFILRFADLFERERGFVLLARQRGRDVAAAVFLTHGGTLTYEFGASDPRRLGSRPNNLLFMEAIRWGCESGHHTLDFGRTDLDNHGLRAFKESWGAQASPLRYHRFGDRPAARSGRLRGLMGPLIRRAPPAFGRLVGSALYPHFG
jgi:CelD/BcsL family acetyltransferase involved in cellulose biosynthesis